MEGEGGLPVRIEAEDDPGVRRRSDVIPIVERDLGTHLEGADPHLTEMRTPAFGPRTVVADQERPPSDRVRHQGPPHGTFGHIVLEGGLGLVDRGVAGLHVHPGVDRQPELVAAERLLDARGLPQGRPQLADDRPERRPPGVRRVTVPHDLRELVARGRPVAFPRENRERQPALPCGEAPFGHQDVAVLDGYVPREVHANGHDAPTFHQRGVPSIPRRWEVVRGQGSAVRMRVLRARHRGGPDPGGPGARQGEARPGHHPRTGHRPVPAVRGVNDHGKETAMVLVTVKGRLRDDPEAIKQIHDGVTTATKEMAQQAGDISHRVYLNPQDGRDFLGSDEWESAEAVQSFSANPQIQEFFGQMFEGMPEVTIYQGAGWNEW